MADQRRKCATEGDSHKHGVMCQSGAYGIARQKRLLDSGLDILTRIIGSQLEWISCWHVGINSRRTSMGRPVTTYGEIFIWLSHQWMGWWAMTQYLYYPLLVESWPRKWTNKYCTSQSVLTAGSQLRLCCHSPPSKYVELSTLDKK